MPGHGRLKEHDPRSKRWQARRTSRPRSVLHTLDAPILDQGELRSCTGNALAQLLNTSKFAASRPRRRYLNQNAAVDLYSVATDLDGFEGTYPPIDTGSSGLAVCKAGVRLGYLTSYQHSFGFDHFADTLVLQPVIVGTNWYRDMSDPDRDGFVEPRGGVDDEHEYLALGINRAEEYVELVNSWSDQWGDRGRFRMTFPHFRRLLAEGGDVTVPIGKR